MVTPKSPCFSARNGYWPKCPVTVIATPPPPPRTDTPATPPPHSQPAKLPKMCFNWCCAMRVDNGFFSIKQESVEHRKEQTPTRARRLPDTSGTISVQQLTKTSSRASQRGQGQRTKVVAAAHCVLAGRKDGVEGSERGSPCGYKSVKNIKSKQMRSIVLCTSARMLCCRSDVVIWF